MFIVLKKISDKKSEDYHTHFNEPNNNLIYNLGEKRNLIFSERDIVASGFEASINMIFSDGKIDLTKMKPPINSRSFKINLMFSDTKINIPEELPVLVKINTIFSDVKEPKNREVSFGGYDYVTKSFLDGQPYIEVRIQAFFSDIKIIPEKEF